MVEVVGTIVNERNMLVGLVIEGKPSDFGEIGGNEDVKKALSLDMAKRLLHNCKNFKIEAGRIIQKGKKRLSDLPMYNNGVVVSNGMYLLSRITADDKIVGFDVKLDTNDAPMRYRYQDVVTLSGWYRPQNFVVKFLEDGKAFISGKPGVMKLEDLPEVKTIQQSRRAAASKERAVNNPAINRREGVVNTKRMGNILENYLDLFTIMDGIRKADGIIIYLPDNSYNNTLDSNTVVGKDFYDLGIGLIGNPYPEHSADKMKVNITFKKPGLVALDNGMRAYTFTYSSRTIIKNGENNIKSLGVAVPVDKAAELIDYFSRRGGEMHISEITDAKFIRDIEGVSGRRDMKYFKLDLSNIDVMSTKRAKESILSHSEVRDLTKKLIYNQMLAKGLKEAIKKYSNGAVHKDIHPMYKQFSAEMLEMLVAKGIDVYSGSYTVREESSNGYSSGSDSTDTPISVGFSIKGYSISGPTAADLVAGNDKAMKNVVYKDILAKDGKFVDMVSGPGGIERGLKALDNIDAESSLIKRKLWMHKAAMLHTTDYKTIYKDCASDWVEVPSRAASAKKFECKACDGLVMSVAGVNVG